MTSSYDLHYGGTFELCQVLEATAFSNARVNDVRLEAHLTTASGQPSKNKEKREISKKGDRKRNLL